MTTRTTHRTIQAVLFSSLLCCLLLALAPTTDLRDATATSTEDDVVLTYDDADALQDVLDELGGLGWATKVDYEDAQVLVIEADDAQAATASAVITALGLLPGVGAVERNLLLSIEPERDGHQSQMAAFDDELGFSHVPSQDGFANFGISSTPEGPNSTTVTVGIVDGGFELGHDGVDTLNIEAEYDFLDGDADAEDLGNGVDDDGNGNADDGQGHGTAILSLIGSIVPDADFVVARALDDEGHGAVGAIAAAIDFCRQNGADVINLSLGDSTWSNVIESMLTAAQSQGVLVVARPRATQASTASTTPPAARTVSPSPRSIRPSPGPASPTTASKSISERPGCEVIAAYGGTTDGYARWCGTSVSAPIVAAAAAVRVQEGDSTDGWDAGQDLITAAGAYPPLPPNEVGKMGGKLDAD